MSIAISYRGMGFPLLWIALPNGSSNQQQRIQLIRRYVRLFGRESIAIVCADREFIGSQWLTWLHQEQIGFRIRIRRDNLLALPGGDKMAPDLLLTRKTRCRKRARCLWGVPVFVGGKPLKRSDHLCIISNVYADVTKDYQQCWSIECLFQTLKGRGFDLEATRITEGLRMCRLLDLLSLALVWAYRMGDWIYEEAIDEGSLVSGSRARKTSSLKRKPHLRLNHGRLARSVFQLGLSFLRRFSLPLSGRFDLGEFDFALQGLMDRG